MRAQPRRANAVDEREHERLERRQAEDDDAFDAALGRLARSRDGVTVLRRWFADAHIGFAFALDPRGFEFASTWDPDDARRAYNQGRQDFGQKMLADIARVVPVAIPEYVALEHLRRDRERAEDAAAATDTRTATTDMGDHTTARHE